MHSRSLKVISNKHHIVKLKTYLSKKRKIERDVPQGSVLGPLPSCSGLRKRHKKELGNTVVHCFF